MRVVLICLLCYFHLGEKVALAASWPQSTVVLTPSGIPTVPFYAGRGRRNLPSTGQIETPSEVEEDADAKLRFFWPFKHLGGNNQNIYSPEKDSLPEYNSVSSVPALDRPTLLYLWYSLRPKVSQIRKDEQEAFRRPFLAARG